MKKPAPTRRKKAGATTEQWELRLYVASSSSNSTIAFNNLKRLCETFLAGRYRIEVIDLQKNPELARGDQIMALPTVVRKLPAPLRKVIGTLADTERVLVGLDLRPRAALPLTS